MDGGVYAGLVDRANLPNGLGKEYYPSFQGGNIQYYGYYLNGNKHGNGKLYKIDGSVSYHGEFINGHPMGNIKRKNLHKKKSHVLRNCSECRENQHFKKRVSLKLKRSK